MRDQGARRFEPTVRDIVDEGFALMREGSSHPSRSEGVEDWEVWMSIAFAQLYNTAMAAWELNSTGYYIQSQMLARLVTEYLAVVWYLPNHPEDAKKWNEERKLPEGSALLKKVFAEDETVGTQFKQFRESLHKFSHLDYTGFTILLGEEEDPRTIPLYIGGRFDQHKFQATARQQLPLIGSIPAAMAQWKRGDLSRVGGCGRRLGQASS
ncbi:MAG TPA: hypothetical protein VGR87_03870 [Candidatus Limnocylindria bacterium]|jgi:hypothetical protein|nr:hypothetical protein [Candidatus Limnocylindria bacterium]